MKDLYWFKLLSFKYFEETTTIGVKQTNIDKV